MIEPSGSRLPPGVAARPVRRFEAHLASPREDLLVVEEPLEIRLAGEPFATIMRTPGHDRDLVLGLLYGEGVIDSVGDVGSLSLCAGSAAASPEGDDGNDEDDGNGANVAVLLPAADRPWRYVPQPRLPSVSSCGVCGKRTIEEALLFRPPPTGAGGGGKAPAETFAAETVTQLPAALRAEQALFSRTGALHAAGVFTRNGELLRAREDIGRHNAVDKVVGSLFLAEKLPLAGHILQVSGRVSFEIVQKAHRAGLTAVVAVSGVSSLAVAFAERVGMTLIGFARGAKFCVYTDPGRLAGD